MITKIETPDVPNTSGLISPGIIANGCIYTAGQIHMGIDGRLVGHSTKERTQQIMKNLGAVLKAGGADFSHVVKVTIYVTDMAFMKDLNAEYVTYFKDPYPVREAVCVKELPLGADIEISMIAVRP